MTDCSDTRHVEYVQRIARLETAIEGLHKLLDERLEREEMARALAANELHRRLDSLNNEASRIKEIQDATVSREVFDVRIGEITSWREGVTKTLAMAVGGGAILGAIFTYIAQAYIHGRTP